MNSIEVYFGEYKTLTRKRLVDANMALQFLQDQYEKTDPNTLKKFDEIWRNGAPPPPQPLLFVNVAKYYDPQKNPHQFEAIKFLNERLSQGTRIEFDRLWFDKPVRS